MRGLRVQIVVQQGRAGRVELGGRRRHTLAREGIGDPELAVRPGLDDGRCDAFRVARALVRITELRGEGRGHGLGVLSLDHGQALIRERAQDLEGRLAVLVRRGESGCMAFPSGGPAGPVALVSAPSPVRGDGLLDVAACRRSLLRCRHIYFPFLWSFSWSLMIRRSWPPSRCRYSAWKPGFRWDLTQSSFGTAPHSWHFVMRTASRRSGRNEGNRRPLRTSWRGPRPCVPDGRRDCPCGSRSRDG